MAAYNALSIITISRADAIGLERTIRSILDQTEHPAQLVLVLSGYESGYTERVLAEVRAIIDCLIICDADSGLYNAMNIGLHRASSPFVLFLNGGDTLASAHTLANIERIHQGSYCLAGRSIQRFEDVEIHRAPRLDSFELEPGMAHQAFIAPRDPSVTFDESAGVNADRVWMDACCRKFGVVAVDENISVFDLGGYSNKPSLRLARDYASRGRYSELFRLWLKFILHAVAGRRRAYILLARAKGWRVDLVRGRSLC